MISAAFRIKRLRLPCETSWRQRADLQIQVPTNTFCNITFDLENLTAIFSDF